MEMAYIAPVAAIIGLAVAFGLSGWIGKVDEGNDRMKEIAGYIREGSMAFLTREYKTMIIVIIALFLIIGFALNNWMTACLYVLGAFLSVLAGYFSMNIATSAEIGRASCRERV